MTFVEEVQEFVKQHDYSLTDEEVENKVEAINDEVYHDLCDNLDAYNNSRYERVKKISLEIIEKILNQKEE